MTEPKKAKLLPASAAEGEVSEDAPRKTTVKPCALFHFGDAGPLVASDPAFDAGSKISSRLCNVNNIGAGRFFGVQLTFPRDFEQATSDEQGLGTQIVIRQHHAPITRFSSNSLVVVSRVHTTPFRYLSEANFTNPLDREVEGWVNFCQPIVQGVTLPDILRQRHFFLVVASRIGPASKNFGDQYLIPVFHYGYPDYQPSTKSEMAEFVNNNLGGEFQACYSFDSDSAHLTAINQSNIQDNLWVDRVANQIAAKKIPAYLAIYSKTGLPTVVNTLNLVVSLPKTWDIPLFDAAWRRLTKEDVLKVTIYDVITPQGVKYKPATWPCHILDHPGTVETLKAHPIEKHEIVLRVLCLSDPKVIIHHFSDRPAANAALEQGEQG
ncbi:hypothetical protein FGRMN_4507 [Fusarium graminum]|nr:hypothetical protein FGRMN_4507 [Fusarium graminum]